MINDLCWPGMVRDPDPPLLSQVLRAESLRNRELFILYVGLGVILTKVGHLGD